MKNKIVMVRKAMALALTMCIVAGMSQNVFAGPSQTKTKTVSPFGTIIAQQEYVGYIRGRKNINFEVTTTNKSSVLIAKVEAGDTLAVLSTGAYNYSMASNYNRNPRPAIVMVKDGKHRLVVKRETYDDVLRNDVI